MRNMSFMLTTQAIRDGTKTVTRRLGWWSINTGDRVMACVKCRGLRPSEKLERIRVIEVVSSRWERLEAITADDCIREGFPEMTPEQFVEMFCNQMQISPRAGVNRIEFKYVEAQ